MDGLIPLEQLIRDAGQHGALQVYCKSYKRYRTSPTRPSEQAHNVEFVLHIACEHPGTADQVQRALQSIHDAAS